MTDHLKGFFESAEYLGTQNDVFLDDFDRQILAAADHIRALKAELTRRRGFVEEVMGWEKSLRKYDQKQLYPQYAEALEDCADDIESIHTKHFGEKK